MQENVSPKVLNINNFTDGKSKRIWNCSHGCLVYLLLQKPPENNTITQCFIWHTNVCTVKDFQIRSRCSCTAFLYSDSNILCLDIYIYYSQMWTAILKCHFHDTEEDEEEGSYGSEEGQDIKAPTFRDLPFSPAVRGPSTFSVVKLEANQKAKIKRERQELYGKGHQEAQWFATPYLRFWF